MIVDAHVHVVRQVRGFVGRGEVVPLPFGKVRFATGETLRILPPDTRDTTFPPEVLVEYMDWVGIDFAVLLQGPLYGFANEELADVVRRWPGRFVAAAAVDPWAADWRPVLEHTVEELNFRIIKLELTRGAGLAGLHPRLRLDDPGFLEFCGAAAGRKVTLVLDLGPLEESVPQREAVRAIAQQWPELRLVLAHLASPAPIVREDVKLMAQWTSLVELARLPNIWMDLSALPYYFRREGYPYPTAQFFVREARDRVGAEKLLWGSDAPMLLTVATYHQLLDLVREKCKFLSKQELDLILGVNATVAYAPAFTVLGGESDGRKTD